MQVTGHIEKGASYYDDIYAQGYNTAGYYPVYQEVIRTVEGIPSPRVLELGCGIGDLGRLLISRGIPYRGFDFSEEGVRQCVKACPQGNFRVGNVYEPSDFRPHDYNVAVSLEVLEHVDDLMVLRHLPPGVRVIGSVPNYDDSAHLRLYRDPRTDIIERFKPFLHTIEVKSIHRRRTDTNETLTIYLFYGIRTLE